LFDDWRLLRLKNCCNVLDIIILSKAIWGMEWVLGKRIKMGGFVADGGRDWEWLKLVNKELKN
jgi:hypothetical protein